MAILTFDANAVRKLLEHARNAPEHLPTFGQKNPEAGLWLVGDQGVYLMSNGTPPLMADGSIGEKEGEGRRMVAYAKGTDPAKNPDWHFEKDRLFGGDDGVDYLPAEAFEKALSDKPTVRIKLTTKHIAVLA